MQKGFHKLPQAFIERIQRIFPKYAASILHAAEKTYPTTFRINHLKTDARQWRAIMQREHIYAQSVAWYRDAFVLQKMTQRDLQKTESYKEGRIYLQNLSSMVPVMVLDPQAGETILDVCAAPGSKTTQMASITANQADIVAIEKIKPRFFRLRANCDIQGATCVQTILGDGCVVARKYTEACDKVLVDAPCSSEGLMRVQNPKSFTHWKPRKIKEMRHKQKKLIDAGFKALKPGGMMVYSTCTFAPEENESVVHWLLERYGNEIEMQPIALPFSNAIPALREADEYCYDERVRYAKRILPTDAMEGFFVAKIKKARKLNS